MHGGQQFSSRRRRKGRTLLLFVQVSSHAGLGGGGLGGKRTDKADAEGKRAECLWMGARIDLRLMIRSSGRRRGLGEEGEEGERDEARPGA